jgi:putative ABC transport system permease protein
MLRIALKTLFGFHGKVIGMVVGLAVASLMMTQQPATMLSILTRTYSFVEDVSQPDIWVMDPMVQFVDDAKPLADSKLGLVRSVTGVAWAVPIFKTVTSARLPDGNTASGQLVGVDDASLIGAPAQMVSGRTADLHMTDAIFVNDEGAKLRFAQKQPNGTLRPLQVGDVLELNEHRAEVVGIAKTGPTFSSQPVIYTTYTRAKSYAPPQRKTMSFVLAKTRPGLDVAKLARQITRETGLAAYTADEFKDLSLWYFIKNTGILINFGMITLVGFIVGAVVSGIMFFNFTQDNLRHFAVLKAIGASARQLLGMVLLQATIVGVIGYGIGIGLASIMAMSSSTFQVKFTTGLLAFSAGGVLLICVLAAGFSVVKVLRLEPAVVFKA